MNHWWDKSYFKEKIAFTDYKLKLNNSNDNSGSTDLISNTNELSTSKNNIIFILILILLLAVFIGKIVPHISHKNCTIYQSLSTNDQNVWQINII